MLWTLRGLRKQANAFLFIAAPACFLFAGYQQYKQLEVARYVSATAIVTRTDTKLNGRYHDVYAYFTMTVDGKEEQGSVTVGSSRLLSDTASSRNRYPAGRTFTVWYDPTDPPGARSTAIGKTTSFPAYKLALVGLAATGIGLLFRRAENRRRRENPLEES